MSTFWLIYSAILIPFACAVLLLHTWRNWKRLDRKIAQSREHFRQDLDRLLPCAQSETDRKLIIALRNLWTEK